MKKIYLLLALLWVSTPLLAQLSGSHAKIPLLEDTFHRTVAKQVKQPAWCHELKRIQTQFAQLGDRARYYDPLPVMLYSPLSHHDTPIYLRRMMQLQQSVGANPALKGFTFVAPVPPDLAQLSFDNYAVLHAFLKDLREAKVTHLERVRPFTLAVQVRGQPKGALEVWIDIPTKKVYLMSNNLYVTAAGKYGLHLK